MPFPQRISRALQRAALLTLLAGNAASAESVRMSLLRLPLAGSQYHEANEQWGKMQVGDRLTLRREPDNRHDDNAIRVEWRGHMIGYLPRARNRILADALDRGERLSGRILRLDADPDPWRRIEIEVFIDL